MLFKSILNLVRQLDLQDNVGIHFGLTHLKTMAAAKEVHVGLPASVLFEV